MLWHRPAAAVPNGPLAWELPNALKREREREKASRKGGKEGREGRAGRERKEGRKERAALE